jgi:predicted transcriptional regulator
MLQEKEIIYYENLSCKAHWRYKTIFDYDFEITDFEIIKLEDVMRENDYCYGIEQYINKFIDDMKERIIRYLPELNKVNIIFGTLDKNNLFYQLAISVREKMIEILNLKVKKIDYYKSIFVIIKYDGKIVFTGDLNFDYFV